ncbi:hypothetical protein ACA910_004461 [Epithemia clementina (nom. ined.)]
MIVLVLMLGNNNNKNNPGKSSFLVMGQSRGDPYGDYNEYGPPDDDYYPDDNNNNNNGVGDGEYGGDYYGDQGGTGDDTLYRDYAARQQEKMMGNGDVAAGGGGPGWIKLFCTGAAGWWAGGKYHSRNVLHKAKRKFQREQKQLYSQYYNDVYKLTEQVQELTYLVEQYQDALKKTEAQHEYEALQRDYDEFKQPDVDGDDRISRAEFNMYVKNYLSHYPGLTEADYPKFEDFDHDKDGYVSFQEYAQQMALQAQQAEKDALKTGTGKSSQKAKALNELYGSTTASDPKKKNTAAKQQATGSFEDIYKQYL